MVLWTNASINKVYTTRSVTQPPSPPAPQPELGEGSWARGAGRGELGEGSWARVAGRGERTRALTGRPSWADFVVLRRGLTDLS
jgi:hypothetical protein